MPPGEHWDCHCLTLLAPPNLASGGSVVFGLSRY
jgi:hypothetical protein